MSPILAVPASSGSGNTGAGTELWCLIGVFLIVAIGLWLFRRSRTVTATRGGVTASSPEPSDPYGTVPTSQLAGEASAMLVAADDSLKTSEQELAYATMQHGAAATGGFSGALAQSQADVGASFHLRQMLDDEIPDDEATQRAWYADIIARCRVADGRLDAQVEAFDRLRNLEAAVETLIPELAKRRDEAVARLPEARSTYESLKQRYAPSAILAVDHSDVQIQERIDFADRSLSQADEALAAGDRSHAALAVRATEEALAQADMIFGSITQLSTNLDTVMSSVGSALADVDSDVAIGETAVAESGSGAPGAVSAGGVDLAAAVAGASHVVQSVRTDMAQSHPDPFSALRRLEQVDVNLCQALDTIADPPIWAARVWDAQARTERARSMLEHAIPVVRVEISAVTSFITTRRAAVGSAARTRLAEAERHLEHAIAQSDTDPVVALTAAQMADVLADQAVTLASNDVDRSARPGFGDSVISMSGLAGAVLGGILLAGAAEDAPRSPDGSHDDEADDGAFSIGFGWGGRLPGSFGGEGTRVRIRL